MSFNTPPFISNCLLAYYRKRIQEQQQLLKEIRNLYPSPLAERIRYCVIDDRKLVVYTDSAAWASLLRFNRPDILTAVNSHPGIAFESIQIRILNPGSHPNAADRTNTNIPSSDNIMLLLKQSEQMSDTALKFSLKKLGETLALKRRQKQGALQH